ncbi:hypothetical protein VULLAG_LOCUS11762 [Vulpes lagopus]
MRHCFHSKTAVLQGLLQVPMFTRNSQCWIDGKCMRQPRLTLHVHMHRYMKRSCILTMKRPPSCLPYALHLLPSFYKAVEFLWTEWERKVIEPSWKLLQRELWEYSMHLSHYITWAVAQDFNMISGLGYMAYFEI